MREPGPAVYYCSPDIVWVKDDGLTLLVHEKQSRLWRLYGVEVAIWDLLCLAYPFHSMVRILSVLLACRLQDAREILMTTLGEWEQQGIIRAAEGIDRG